MLYGREGRDEQDLRERLDPLDALEQLQPRIGLLHAQVGDHRVRGIGLEGAQRVLETAGPDRVESSLAQRLDDALAEDLLVLDYQNPSSQAFPPCPAPASRTVNRHPPPSARSRLTRPPFCSTR